MLTKGKLLQRIEELDKKRQSLVAEANMCSGALQECQRILKEEFPQKPVELEGSE
jgi:hypothetical protein